MVDRVRPAMSDGALLLVYKDSASEFQTLCTISGLPPNSGINFRHNVVNLCGKAILGSSRGWFILRTIDDATLLSLFNPRTGQSLHLPPLEEAVGKSEWDFNFTLTSPPDLTDTDASPCVFYLFLDGFMFSCRPTRPDCSWVRHRVKFDGKSSDSIRRMFCFKGCLHGWAQGRFVSAEIRGNDHDLDRLTFTDPQISNLRSDLEYASEEHFLIECCGHFYCTLVSFITTMNKGIVCVKVYELDLEEKRWKQVNRLDGHAFFFDLHGGGEHLGSTWCWGAVSDPDSTCYGGVKQNCVYLLYSPRESGGLTIYEYDLGDQSLTPICPCPNLEHPNDDDPICLMPKQPRLVADQGFKYGRENDEKVDTSKGEGNGQLLKLPLHLIEYIAKYLHLFDYWSFRASCRLFLSAAPPTNSWRTNNLYPSFLFFKNDAGLCSLLDPFRHGTRSCMSCILQLSPISFEIVFSKNDWILFLVARKYLKFINPFTREMRRFPLDEHLAVYDSFGFSTNPASDDCVTVAVCDSISYGLMFHYFRSGDKQWKWNGIVINNEQGITFKPSFNTPVFYQGSFWFLDACGYIGALTLADGQESWSVFEKPDTGESSKFNAPFLVEWAGKLCSVFIGEMGRGVKIFVFDSKLEKKWREVEDLGDQILFISPTFCCSRAVRDVNLRNRIYLPRLKGNSIVYYSLDTRKYHVSGSQKEESMDDLYNTKEPMKCCWI